MKVLLVLLSSFFLMFAVSDITRAQTDVWTAAYWAEWSHIMDGDAWAEGRTLKSDSVDWTAINLHVHANIQGRDSNTGELDTTDQQGFRANRIADIVNHAHSITGPTHPKIPVIIS